jgi:hypothetical protein
MGVDFVWKDIEKLLCIVERLFYILIITVSNTNPLPQH